MGFTIKAARSASAMVPDGCAVAVCDDGIAGPDYPRSEFPDFEFGLGLLLPGLIDLHAHPAKHGSVFGVDPDAVELPSGVTTVMSQGDAGADGVAEYVESTIRVSKTRVRLAINLSRVGESTKEGCFESIELADVDACVAAIEDFRENIWGIAVNTSRHACGEKTDPREVLQRGIEAAERTGMPLLYGMRCPEDWPLAEQLALLRAGDVVTYCFRRTPHCIVSGGHVLPEIREARERGVLFDVGHGMASFDFGVAEAAIADGFLPDTISTDLQRRHVEVGERHDLPLVMSKLLAAGMPEDDIFPAVTTTPARILGLQDEIGDLKPGMCADVTVLEQDGNIVLRDASGQTRTGPAWRAVMTMRAGEMIQMP